MSLEHDRNINNSDEIKSSNALPNKKPAACYTVPSSSMVNVEHPMIVSDVLKAVESLGGSKAIEKLVQVKNSNQEASLFLHPRDRMSRSIPSAIVNTSNVLLKITVPKMTGRKRKRGSTTPYVYGENLPVPTTASKTTRHLLRGLTDNPKSYVVEPVGAVEQTHRFRDMPDFVWSTVNGSFMQKMRDHILPFDYEKIKDFKFDMKKEFTGNTELIPPPAFSHLSMPFNYAYRQNPAVKQVVDSSGNVTTLNLQTAFKTHLQRVSFDVSEVPTGLTDNTPPVSILDQRQRQTLKKIEECMDRRPIWTRRALSNEVGIKDSVNFGRALFRYVGYMFASGPWRDALIKFGIDPRTDPQYRIYQTLVFQFDGEAAARRSLKVKAGASCRAKALVQNKESHIFDGITWSAEGRAYQVCDITDPMVQKLLATSDLRRHCHLKRDGWYHNGTLAKAKVIIRGKMLYIQAGTGIPPDTDYMRIAALPDIINRETRPLAVLTKPPATSQEMEMANSVRTIAKLETDDEGEGASEVIDPRVEMSVTALQKLRQRSDDDEQDASQEEDLDGEESDSSSTGEEVDGNADEDPMQEDY